MNSVFPAAPQPCVSLVLRDVGHEELPFLEDQEPAHGAPFFILFEQDPWWVLKIRTGGFVIWVLLGSKQTPLFLLQRLCCWGQKADKPLSYFHGFQLDKAPSTEQPLKWMSQLSHLTANGNFSQSSRSSPAAPPSSCVWLNLCWPFPSERNTAAMEDSWN